MLELVVFTGALVGAAVIGVAIGWVWRAGRSRPRPSAGAARSLFEGIDPPDPFFEEMLRARPSTDEPQRGPPRPALSVPPGEGSVAPERVLGIEPGPDRERGSGIAPRARARSRDADTRRRAPLGAELLERLSVAERSPSSGPAPAATERRDPPEPEGGPGLDLERIGRAGVGERDDLQRIRGIGPAMEWKLNALGIYTFRQIANLTSGDETRLCDRIGAFPGAVRRDGWVRQAREMLGGDA